RRQEWHGRDVGDDKGDKNDGDDVDNEDGVDDEDDIDTKTLRFKLGKTQFVKTFILVICPLLPCTL
ncbi:hypothetical protein U1Q18_040132, partial [Sarracenia purpurea var. burkii]